MDALLLCFRGEPMREYPLGTDPIRVGKAAHCEIAVVDPEVDEHHLTVLCRDGQVVAEYAADPLRSRVLAPGVPLPLGLEHTLLRVAGPGGDPRATEPIEGIDPGTHGLSLVIGHGKDARRVGIGRAPLSVGTGPENQVVLSDPTVSRRHCRVELYEGRCVVHDLGSRNGTWLDGVRVVSATVGPGALLRVGRSDLRLVPRCAFGAREDFVCASPAMRAVLADVERYARLPFPVLVSGETGVGKEGVARALHDRGPRASGPFVAVNAGGVSPTLVESQLFGHERGAFTGAAGRHRGVFEQAGSGTLFLDEIGELSFDLQARLLRVLERWEVRPLGAERPVRVDVRLVCATHRDLRAMVREGAFRNDLYHRLSSLVLHVPPLRERPADVSALTRHFLRHMGEAVAARDLTEAALSRLLGYGFPGNVRELRNILRAAAASSGAGVIDAPDIERALRQIAGPEALELGSAAGLAKVVERHGGNISAAARALGMPRTTLRDRLRGLSVLRPAPFVADAG